MIARTELNQIEIVEDETGQLMQLRFAKIIANGDVEMSRHWHRTAIRKADDVDAHIDMVNTHLASMGYPQVPQDAIQRIKNFQAVL